jgi:hypothetical protein
MIKRARLCTLGSLGISGVLGILATSMVCATPASAQGLAETLNLSPFWKWKQIETEHFRVTFPSELSETAERAANNLEEANSVLSRTLYWQPSRKVPILLIDNVDSANGLTAAVERFGITLYVTPPDDWYSTAYYDDWLRLLCFHEYTHFVNTDAARGLYAPSRYLFGDVLLPNSIWPNWMLEGLAVWDETRFTHAGRGRSPYYEMVLRTEVEAGALDNGKGFTLDRINSLNVPYYPGGEAVYLFGYELMNQVAKNNHAGPTADGKTKLKSGEDALGVMSYRSSYRIPFLLNGNLKNITGRDWYSYWDQFVTETRARAGKELARIQKYPVTKPQFMTHGDYQVLGSAFSPDGKWVAYTAVSLDQENSLFLMDLKTGKEKQIAQKVQGARLAFTPDSQFVVFSGLKRQDIYYSYSEIGVYSLQYGTVKFISSKGRARDPDVSHDGKKIVFTVTENGKTGIAEADITPKGKSLALSNVHWTFSSGKYDVASSPRFSLNDQEIFFSLHRNEHKSEELVEMDRDTQRSRILFGKGKFNRYPTVTSRGELLFVSDWTGVDNLYRFREGKEPELMTNTTTGISFPSTDTQGGIYASVFTSSGWNFAKIEPLTEHISPQSVAIEEAPAPATDQDSEPKHLDKKYVIEDYSVIPSIWPRAWIPYAMFTPGNFSFGDSLTGYDTTDRHRYEVNLGYDTLSSKLDWFAQYQNRFFGPTVSFAAGDQLSYTSYSNGSLYEYTRDKVASIDLTYPVLWTFSSLTPNIAFTLDKTSYYYPGADTATRNYDYQTRYLPSMDVVLAHSSAERSALGISPEEGRDFAVGMRYFFDNGNGTQQIKGLLEDTEYLRLGQKSHFVLVPSVKASYTSANPATNPNQNSDVVLQGHLPVLIGGFANPTLSSLPVRGYPDTTFYIKSAVVSSLDLRFPIADVFRGWGTNPFFLDQIYGFVFAEDTFLPDGFTAQNEPKFLPSTGGGLSSNLEVFIQVPVTFSVEYHYGFQMMAGGGGEVFASLAYTGFNF